MAGELELTDTEIDALVAAVSEEVDPTSNEDDVDLDLEEDITGTGEMKVTSETLATENDFADEVVNKTHLSTASYVDYQDTNSVSIDKQTHEVTDGEPDKASSKTEQSQTCSDSQVVDVCAQMAKSIPGKAQPAVVGAVSPEVPVVDKKPEDSKYDPLNIVKTLSELARNPGLEASSVSVVDSRTRDMKPRDLQQSKKRDNKSLSSGQVWGWRSLGSWSSSVLSTATSFTSHVGESFYNVLETVESSLIEPEDESHHEQRHHEQTTSGVNKGHLSTGSEDDAAAASDTERKQSDRSEKDTAKRYDVAEDTNWLPLPGFNLSSLTQLTGTVTSTGKKMVSTGLGVIGDIGKKTYNILMEDDEDSHAATKTNKNSASVAHHDDAGIAHFEALEELSRWSSETLGKQLSGLKGKSADAVHNDLALINDSFHLGDFADVMDASDKEHDFVRLVTDFVSQLGLQLNVSKLIETQANTRKWLVEQSLKVPELQQLEPQKAYDTAFRSFSDLMSASVALYHKVAQLLLIENSGNPLLSYKFRALSLVGLTKVLCFEIYIQSSQFSHLLLSGNTQSDVIKSLVEGIELEASHSAKCLQDACCHLQPIMQLAVTRMHPLLPDHSGVAHLEGLQVLSNMSLTNIREALSQFEREARHGVEAHLADIETSFDLGYLQAEDAETESDSDKFSHHMLEFVQQLTTDTEAAHKLVAVQQRIQKYLKDCERDQSLGHLKILTNDIHQTGVQSLTDWMAVSIELYYTIAQSVLVEQPCDVSMYVQKAATLASLTKLLCIEVGHVSSQFTRCLSAATDQSDSATPFVTNIYVEASSTSTCIQDGFHLLLPIIQLALLKAEPLGWQHVVASTPDHGDQ